jgi:negative regulator of flagellin synthesis FlgM
MQITGPTSVHGAQGISAPHNVRSASATAPTRSTLDVSDELHISDSARIADQMSQIPDIRHDRVAAIRTAIADGTYDTDAKMSVALDRLLDEIG